MRIPRELVREAKTRWHQALYRRPAWISPGRAVLSISFDDVPTSAFERAAPLLEQNGVRGTFYVSLGIAPDEPGEFIGEPEVRDLFGRGHEVGCHTFSHYRLSEGRASAMADDAAANRNRLAAITEGHWPRAFSFPFGELDFEAKRRLAPHYQTLRSSRPGINRGRADLNCLRAVSLGPVTGRRQNIDRWLGRLQQHGGWMIAYSHGVVAEPGPFDITTNTLHWLIDGCDRRGITIMPVTEYVQSIGLYDAQQGSAASV